MQAQPLLLTGHRDGRVRMWDMSCEVPRLLGTAPHDLGRGRQPPATCVHY